MELVRVLRSAADDAADALTGAQQAANHLWAILEAWEECDDDEKRETVETALRRLNRQ
jgi:hypothetical protein